MIADMTNVWKVGKIISNIDRFILLRHRLLLYHCTRRATVKPDYKIKTTITTDMAD
jgi:hypothetical protein